MLSTESRVEKLLPPDIQAEGAEKKDENQLNNPLGRRPSLFMGDQADNLKQLKLFPPLVLFWLDVEDRKRMLVKKLKGGGAQQADGRFLKIKTYLHVWQTALVCI